MQADSKESLRRSKLGFLIFYLFIIFLVSLFVATNDDPLFYIPVVAGLTVELILIFKIKERFSLMESVILLFSSHSL